MPNEKLCADCRWYGNKCDAMVGEYEGRKLFACMVEFKDGARCYRKVLD